MRLYHYTCGHAAPLIGRDYGLLRPHPQIQLGGVALIWFTDMEWPDRAALGLTSHTLRCDRTEYRCAADLDATRWVKFARTLRPALRHGLEWAPGARPMHWWVATEHTPVLAVERVAELADVAS